MIQRVQDTQEVDGDTRLKWFGSPVTVHKGRLSDIRRYIPTFERRVFGLTQPDDKLTRFNESLDTIVRLPFGEDKAFIPVGVVSKNYALVPHTDVLDVATRALEAAKIAPVDVEAEMKITEYGERMDLSLYLPDKYSVDPGDGHPIALRLECFNSVDGSTRFRALMGWFRFVCSNGLIIGVTRSDMRRRHVGDLRIEDIGAVLGAGLNEFETEKSNLRKWRNTPIAPRRLQLWTDDALRKGWGFKAATRAFHIARSGNDVKITGQYKDSTPTTIAVQQAKPVPGAPGESRNLYDVSQILAWLAKERREVNEQLEWRAGIAKLMYPLMS